MENPRPEKVAVVDEVRDKLSASSAALLTEYRGLNVKAMADLRRALRDSGGEVKVYKNTLVRFAARDLGIEALDELLTGPTAIAFVDGDAAAVAKALRDYARTNPTLVVKGGVLGTSVLSAEQVTALAELPSREVLLAQIAGAFQAPAQRFAGLLQALPRNFAYGLQALIDKQGGAPEAEAEPAAAEPAAAEASDAPDVAPDGSPAEAIPDAAPDDTPAPDVAPDGSPAEAIPDAPTPEEA